MVKEFSGCDKLENIKGFSGCDKLKIEGFSRCDNLEWIKTPPPLPWDACSK
jgi:hypothetical protein